jgi:hypothetical protein
VCAPIMAVPMSPTSRFLIPFSTRPVDHALGADHVSVTDIYLPHWIAMRIFTYNAPLVALAALLHARVFLSCHRPNRVWTHDTECFGWGRPVMNPLAFARGLQLPRNDKGAASGCMTPSLQDQSPAACAPSGAWMRSRRLNPSVDVGISRRQRFLPATRRICSWPGISAAITVRSSEGRGAFAHTDSRAPQKGDGASPCLKAGISAPEKSEHPCERADTET